MRLRTPLGWAAERWTLGARALRWGTTAALVASILIVLGGATVRVTGSGLGCPDWPTCDGTNVIQLVPDSIHTLIEQTNRLLTSVLIAAVGWAIVAARLQPRRDRTLTRLAWSMFWLVIANAVAGGFSVWYKLNPWIVALHFVLAMGLLACATFTWHRARWHGGDGPRPSIASRSLAWALVIAAAALILAGTLVTGSGPHAGDSSEVPRMGFDWTVVVWVHGLVAVLVLALATALAFRLRAEEGGRLALRRVGIFLLVLLVQLAVGATQSLIGLPEVLVIAHVVLAALVWVGALRVLLDTDPRLWAVRDSTAHAQPSATRTL
ncbi:COX15/CtaA family protein [Protaetiibacter larvae]|uniref:Cytochrome oxidase assembly protein n=1 Tax=Protaetiibacter larvae TaxID=2592654 RepID=A0A5C1YB37_9MICO|nr:COX15/CtaA family protein [Protaetiibacter larvae]QEO10067.1 cytochrome oxidase assembly protein [Protaetiibacter larvae]